MSPIPIPMLMSGKPTKWQEKAVACEASQSSTRERSSGTSETDSQSGKRIELKFVIDVSLARELRDWARANLQPDPLAAAADPGSDSYRISTLYLDTPELGLFHRAGNAGRTKHRVRRYGSEEKLWLESKRKVKSVVVKRRTCIDEEELGYLCFVPRIASIDSGTISDEHDDQTTSGCEPSEWAGAWFQQRVTSRRLAPSAMVYYERFARIGGASNDAFRFTIDRELKGEPYRAWGVPVGCPNSLESLVDSEILELKFRSVMPPILKELLASFPLLATGFSKYRTCLKHLQSL